MKGAADSEDAEELAYPEGSGESDESVEDDDEEIDDEEDEEEDDEEEFGDEEDDEEEFSDEEDDEEEFGDEEDDEEEFGDEEDDEEEFGDEEDDDEEEAEKQEKKGFFARIFGWGDDDSDDEIEDEEAMDEEDMDEEEEGDMDSEEDMGEEEEVGYSDSAEDDFGEETGLGGEADDGMVSSQPAASASSEKPLEEGVVEGTKPRIISLKKIKRKTYRKGAYLVNAVYIARKGDAIESVSQKIYNSDQTATIYAINPHLRSRSVKVGDKIYYSSPRRPQDSSKILIYYEELGIPPRTHVISPGENIRSVSRNLLGHENSWKEIWAINPTVISKGVVSEAVELRYWLDESPPAPDVDGEDEGVVEEEETDMMEQEGVGEDGMPEEAGDEEDKEDSDEVLPGPVDTNRKKKAEWVIVVGVFLLILLSLATLVIKKRRGKREFDYTSTNIQPLS